VLVKWWLLALPHFRAIRLRGRRAVGQFPRDRRWRLERRAGRGGLVGLLVLIGRGRAASLPLATQVAVRLVMGMDRWSAASGGYAGLMTDAYPPSGSTRARRPARFRSAPPRRLPRPHWVMLALSWPGSDFAQHLT